MDRSEISMPFAKAGTAITAAAAAKADVADKVAMAASANASPDTWMIVNSIPWGTVASMAAAAYTLLLITEWFWKKLWRPFFESRGWLKAKRRRVITVEEYESSGDTDKAPL
jgi:hypothetical protein